MAQQRNGVGCTIFADSQAAMTRIGNDPPGPGQDLAIRITELATTLYGYGNTLATG